MIVRSYLEMLKEYAISDLDSDDKEDRIKMLSQNSYSVIFEGDFLEFDNVKTWLKENINKDPINFLFYGKLGYDYGFFEVFLNECNHAIELTQAIPNIFTTYFNETTAKTNGLDNYNIL